jgi:hypothetical protein
MIVVISARCRALRRCFNPLPPKRRQQHHHVTPVPPFLVALKNCAQSLVLTPADGKGRTEWFAPTGVNCWRFSLTMENVVLGKTHGEQGDSEL